MATSAEKIAELKAKKAQRALEESETKAMQKLYAHKVQIDNSTNRSSVIFDDVTPIVQKSKKAEKVAVAKPEVPAVEAAE